MKLVPSLSVLLLATSVAFIPATYAAGPMGEDETAVWSVIEASWEDETGETGAWPSEYIHDDAHGWGAEWPMPRDAESLANWSRFGAESGQSLIYELFPMNVTVSGDTAVVYYASVQVRENHEDERERTSTGLVETLVRTDAGWKFIGLTSFELGDD
ncbi:SnoaL-like domain-containing protein [Wenzhouxiangella sp. XN79A]|uniref:nuclear transport factor 2 family protein n=1 Tax=Wenzhouxiangella sp. XN79A TaxID=2724193 RepID=UPI00144A5E8A|nr:nuclear transport factor 2 family protein [Wenzhouxiangella sp. XN79A]NKI34779.1 SnoaL-like domain-containing protein [Wenzhouxiangella sp. XN79A]